MDEKSQTHAECNISDLDLFTPAFVQTDILKGRYEEVFPLSNIEDGGPIEFSLENATHWVMLKESTSCPWPLG